MKNKKTINMYMERCWAVLCEEGEVPNASYIMKRYEKGKNVKPYKTCLSQMVIWGLVGRQSNTEGKIVYVIRKNKNTEFAELVGKQMPGVADVVLRPDSNVQDLADAFKYLPGIQQKVWEDPSKAKEVLYGLIDKMILKLLETDKFEDINHRIEEILEAHNPNPKKFKEQ